MTNKVGKSKLCVLNFFFTKSERTLENIETIMNFMFNLYEPGCIEVAFFNFKRLQKKKKKKKNLCKLGFLSAARFSSEFGVRFAFEKCVLC